MLNVIIVPEETISLQGYLPPKEVYEIPESANSETDIKQAWSDLVLKTEIELDSNGSVYLEKRASKVMVHVPKPRGTRPFNGIGEKVKLNYGIKYGICANRTNMTLETAEFFLLREVKQVVENTICDNDYINMSIDIKVVVLDDGGSVIAMAINGLSLALMLAGISIFDIISASSVCLFRGEYYHNPNGDLEDLASDEGVRDPNSHHCVMTCSSHGRKGIVPQIYCDGSIEADQFKEMIDICSQLNTVIRTRIHEIIVEYVIHGLEKEKSFEEYLKIKHERARRYALKRHLERKQQNLI